MKNILIISATKGQNLNLANSICESIDTDFNKKVIVLEDFILPLFTASTHVEDKSKYLSEIKKITNELVNSDGLVFCAPEYNGSIPPIVTNVIAWISVTTDYWRDAFVNKVALIATNSGGAGIKYNIAIKNQLEHLGMIVIPQYISVSGSNLPDSDSTKIILKQFIKHL